MSGFDKTNHNDQGRTRNEKINIIVLSNKEFNTTVDYEQLSVRVYLVCFVGNNVYFSGKF